MPSALRSIAVFAFVSAVAVLSAPGCSQQGEGERCDNAKNGDLDCDGGLLCVRKSELLEGITDRCCPSEGTESDKRCTRGTPVSTGGSSSGGSSSGGTAAGGTPAGGDSSGGAPVAGTGGEAAGASGSPTSSDGGMSSGGTPATTDGGAGSSSAGASSIAGQGGAG
jgi:hypothetical protein